MSGMDEAGGALAVVQSVFKAAARQARTGDPDNVRGRAEAEFRKLMESSGVDKVKLRVNGEDVGTMQMTYTKATEGPEVTDPEAYEKWLGGRGEETEELHLEWLTPEQRHTVAQTMRRMNPASVVPASRMPDAMARTLQEGPGATVLTAEGEVVDGMTWVRHPKAPKALTVRGCELGDVAAALGGMPASKVLGLIEGESDVD